MRVALKRTRTFLTARSTVLALILLLTAAMTAAVVVRQTGLIPSEGNAAEAGPPAPPHRAIELLGLHHVFSTWWFAGLSAVFVVSLLLSTLDQLRVARARMLQLPPEGQDGGAVCALPRAEAEALLRREGYRQIAHGAGRARWVKWWPGYFGQLLLHLGMTITVLFAATYVLTERRVVVRAVSGTGVPVEGGGQPERRGLLALPLPLPAKVTLFRLEPTFWADDHLQDLASDLVFTDEQGVSRDVRVGVNDQQRYRGFTLYQLTSFGNAFLVQLRNGGGGETEMTLPLAIPSRRDAASYGTFPLADGRLQLKAKYYANADRARIQPENPQLVLRLYEGERLVEERSLLTGETGRLGPYEVRLAAVAWWTDILFEGSVGTTGIFTGFTLLMLGGLLTFFVVPREAVLREAGEACTLSWRATRFADFYEEEGARIMSRCKGGPQP